MDNDYMEVPCKYCSSFRLIALKCNEYLNGRVVVSAMCEHCKKKQKISNNIKKCVKSVLSAPEGEKHD